MKNRLRLSPFLSDILITTLVSLFTVGAFIILARVLAIGLGPEKFGAYSVSRRLLATLEPLSTLSLGIALARYVAMSQEARLRFSYLLGSLILVIGINFVIILVSWVSAGGITAALFRQQQYLGLFWATVFSVFTYSCFIVLYGFYRGSSRMNSANLLQLMLVAVWPLLVGVIFSPSGDLERIVWVTGAGYLVAFFPLAIRILRGLRSGFTFRPEDLRELLNYGIPRLPGGLAYTSLLAVATFLCPFFVSLQAAGYLALSLSVLKVAEGAFDSFGRVILPKVAQIHADQECGHLKDKVGQMSGFAIQSGIFLTCQIFIWADVLILSWLGMNYGEVIGLLRIFSLAIVPFLVFSILRAVIDAVEVKAINTGNLLFSLLSCVVACLVFAALGWGAAGLAWGTVAGVAVLGILSLSYVVRRFSLEWGRLLPAWCLGLNAVCAFISLTAKLWGAGRFSGAGNLVLMATVFAGCLAVYFWGLGAGKADWLKEIRKRIEWGGQV